MGTKNEQVLNGLYETFTNLVSGEDVKPVYVNMVTKTADSIYKQRMAAVCEKRIECEMKQFEKI